jgi:hypothetical protein
VSTGLGAVWNTCKVSSFSSSRTGD